LKLADYDPEGAAGPAIWIRSVLAQPEKATLPEHISKRIETNPWVIHLPGVAKAEFSEAE
jgi:hypothetical protein